MEAPSPPSFFETSVGKLTVYRRPEWLQPQERSWRFPSGLVSFSILLLAPGPLCNLLKNGVQLDPALT